jgi:hypothetical protein
MSYLLEAIDWRNPRDIGFALSCRIRARISLPGQHESTALPDLSRIVTQATGKGRAGERNTGVSISGHLRFCIAAFVLLAGLPISPASPNPLAEFFNAAPRQTTAPASAERQCSPRPGTSRTAGQHWVYRLEGHRKCWFQAAEGIATVKKQVRNRAAEPRVAAPEENEAARRERKAVVDAHAELLRSARAVTSRPMRPAPELKVVNAASVFVRRVRPSCQRRPSKTSRPISSRPITPRRARSTRRRFWRPHRRPATRLRPPCLRPRRSPFPLPRRLMTGWIGRQLGLACC